MQQMKKEVKEKLFFIFYQVLNLQKANAQQRIYGKRKNSIPLCQTDAITFSTDAVCQSNIQTIKNHLFGGI